MGNLNRTLQHQTDVIQQLTSQMQQQAARIQELESQLAQSRNENAQLKVTPDSVKDTSISNHELTIGLLKEMICLLSIDPKHRRFTSAMLDFAFLMHSLSNKAYKQLQTVLPLPSKETIRLHFQDRLRSALAEALNLEQLPHCFYKYRRQIDYDGVVVSMMTPSVGMTLPVSPLDHLLTSRTAVNYRLLTKNRVLYRRLWWRGSLIIFNTMTTGHVTGIRRVRKGPRSTLDLLDSSGNFICSIWK